MHITRHTHATVLRLKSTTRGSRPTCRALTLLCLPRCFLPLPKLSSILRIMTNLLMAKPPTSGALPWITPTCLDTYTVPFASAVCTICGSVIAVKFLKTSVKTATQKGSNVTYSPTLLRVYPVSKVRGCCRNDIHRKSLQGYHAAFLNRSL